MARHLEQLTRRQTQASPLEQSMEVRQLPFSSNVFNLSSMADVFTLSRKASLLFAQHQDDAGAQRTPGGSAPVGEEEELQGKAGCARNSLTTHEVLKEFHID
ncbi:hypothetical protein NQZ68_004989 [Dissostichus eleginoides]|nr:hypothetical protein NQZ68_004989 [Dissostichus eleginoides]